MEIDATLIASVARFALDSLHVNPAAELSVLAVTEDAMSELHERWMDEPGPTDVMSFPMDELLEVVVDRLRRLPQAGDAT